MTQTLDIRDVMVQRREWWGNRRETINVLSRYLGITQTRLSEMTGLSRQTVHARLTGSSKMEPWEIDGFALALGVPPEVVGMEPEEAVRWVLDHPEVVARSKCSYRETQHVA